MHRECPDEFPVFMQTLPRLPCNSLLASILMEHEVDNPFPQTAFPAFRAGVPFPQAVGLETSQPS